MFDNVSEECKDLISKLLRKGASNRITVNEALKHKWFEKQAEVLPAKTTSDTVEHEVVARLRGFKGQSQVRKTAMNILVKMESSSNNEIVHLRQQFEAIDTENTGLIDAKKLLNIV